MKRFSWALSLLLGGCAGAAPAPPPLSAASAEQQPRVAPPGRSVTLEMLGTTPKPPWRHARVKRDDGPEIDVYVAHDQRPKPLLVLLQGSNCLPLFGERIRDDGRVNTISSNLFQGAENELLDRVHLAVVERHGVTSFGPPIPPDAWPPARITPACAPRANDKKLRVRDVADAILALGAQRWITRTWIAGHSEGSDVATGVARLLGTGRVHAVGLFAGAGGASQFFDNAALMRNEGNHRDAVATIEDMVWLLDHPRESGSYEGVERYAVPRWKSFAIDSTARQDLAGLELPVFVAHGSADKNVPPETADLFVVERLRAGRGTIAYHSLVGLDHGLMCEDGSAHATGLLAEFVAYAAHPANKPVIRHREPCAPH